MVFIKTKFFFQDFHPGGLLHFRRPSMQWGWGLGVDGGEVQGVLLRGKEEDSGGREMWQEADVTHSNDLMYLE